MLELITVLIAVAVYVVLIGVGIIVVPGFIVIGMHAWPALFRWRKERIATKAVHSSTQTIEWRTDIVEENRALIAWAKDNVVLAEARTVLYEYESKLKERIASLAWALPHMREQLSKYGPSTVNPASLEQRQLELDELVREQFEVSALLLGQAATAP